MESQNTLIHLPAALVCECSLSVTLSLRVFSDAETLVLKFQTDPGSLSSHSLISCDSFPKLDSENTNVLILCSF